MVRAHSHPSPSIVPADLDDGSDAAIGRLDAVLKVLFRLLMGSPASPDGQTAVLNRWACCHQGGPEWT